MQQLRNSGLPRIGKAKTPLRFGQRGEKKQNELISSNSTFL